MTCTCGFEFCYFCGEQWSACTCDTARPYTTRMVQPFEHATEDMPQESAEAGTSHADLILRQFEQMYHAQVLRMRHHIADKRPREAISSVKSNTGDTSGEASESSTGSAPDGRECEHDFIHLIDDTECDLCTEDTGHGTYQCLICYAVLCDLCLSQMGISMRSRR
ncbi:hypothetical protein BDZ85DRAFT_253999 [Elsinoe ampelina]|uniref:RING-type domain-containing protein n=1 Tax=Elsinoe ampelina TaxID=302913 RepID=A0A6A6GND1_9PEZI|nr:hypothetical protein BDZ85DRAFT_253999 [Elsinoe ampelina]